MHCATTLFTQSAAATRTPGFYARKNRRFIKTLSLSISPSRSTHPLETWLASPKSTLSLPFEFQFSKNSIEILSTFSNFHFSFFVIRSQFRRSERKCLLSRAVFQAALSRVHSRVLKARINIQIQRRKEREEGIMVKTRYKRIESRIGKINCITSTRFPRSRNSSNQLSPLRRMSSHFHFYTLYRLISSPPHLKIPKRGKNSFF